MYTYRVTGQTQMASGVAAPVYTAHYNGVPVATVAQWVTTPGGNRWGATSLANAATGAGATRSQAVAAALAAPPKVCTVCHANGHVCLPVAGGLPCLPGTYGHHRVFTSGTYAVGAVWQAGSGMWHAQQYNPGNALTSGPLHAAQTHAAVVAALLAPTGPMCGNCTWVGTCASASGCNCAAPCPTCASPAGACTACGWCYVCTMCAGCHAGNPMCPQCNSTQCPGTGGPACQATAANTW